MAPFVGSSGKVSEVGAGCNELPKHQCLVQEFVRPARLKDYSGSKDTVLEVDILRQERRLLGPSLPRYHLAHQ